MSSYVILRFKNEIIKLLGISIVSILIFLNWKTFGNTGIYLTVSGFMYHMAAKLTELFSAFFSFSLKYDTITGILSDSGNSWKLIMPVDAYPIYFILTLSGFLLPAKKYYTVLIYAFSTTVFIVARAVVIILFKIYGIYSVHFVWLQLIDSTIYLPAFFWMVYLIKNNSLFLFYSTKINVVIQQISYFTFQQLIFILIVFPAIPRIILTYIDNAIPVLATSILSVSKYILTLFGSHVIVEGKTIFWDNNWLRLENPCIGIGVWTIVLIMIFSTRGNILNKLIYIPIFTLFFLFTNSLRMAFALQYVHHNFGHKEINFRLLHDSITYLMYLIAFVFLAGYILWFHNIDFKKR